MKLVLFFFGICIISLNSRAIVNGVPFDTSDSHTSSSFVSLRFNLKGLPSDPCSGSYLGRGQIITAAHCFLLNEVETEDPEICIEDIYKTEKLCVHKMDYTTHFPSTLEQGFRAPTRKSRKVIRVPKPDLVIFKLKNKNFFSRFKSIKILPRLNKIPNEADTSNLKLSIIGQGCNDYAPVYNFGELPKGVGFFRRGYIHLNSDENNHEETKIEYSSRWTTEDSVLSSICWGDSGGALTISSDINVDESPLVTEEYLLGVISYMKKSYDPKTGLTAKVTSFYTRLQHPEIQSWLSGVLTF